MSGGCGRLKRLVCWMWHRNGHWTAEEIAAAERRADELLEYFGEYEPAPQQPMSEESGERT